MKQILTLSETLHHPGFSWPESLVFLPAEKPESPAFHLTDAQGGEYAAQWVESEKKIALVTALDCAEEKRFTVQPGSAARTMRCGGEDAACAFVFHPCDEILSQERSRPLLQVCRETIFVETLKKSSVSSIREACSIMGEKTDILGVILV